MFGVTLIIEPASGLNSPIIKLLTGNNVLQNFIELTAKRIQILGNGCGTAVEHMHHNPEAMGSKNASAGLFFFSFTVECSLIGP